MKWLLITCLSVLSCNSKQSETDKTSKETDSLIFKAEVSRRTDSIMKTIGSEVFKKAELLSPSCPIKIKSIKIHTQDYSVSKAYAITYQNSSDKPIDAIKFIVYGENNWGDPEPISILGSAYGYCESQIKILPGKTVTNSWEAQTGDPTKAKCHVVKVHFINGEVWDIDKQ
jgi:hypothetical protein